MISHMSVRLGVFVEQTRGTYLTRWYGIATSNATSLTKNAPNNIVNSAVIVCSWPLC